MTTRHRRRPRLRALLVDLTPEQELDVRVTRRPADVAEALDELDTTLGKLHSYRIFCALNTVERLDDVLPEYRDDVRKRAAWYVACAQAMRTR